MDNATAKNEATDGHLKAAHQRLERELVRLLAGQDAKSVKLRIDGAMSYPSAGEVRVVTYSELISYCDGLQMIGAATYRTSPPLSVDITLSEKGLATFTATDFYRLMLARDYAARPAPARPEFPSDGSLMSAIMATLFFDKQCRRSVLVEKVSTAIAAPIAEAIAGKAVPDGPRLRKAFDRAMTTLERNGLVEKKGKQYEPSQAAWRMRAKHTLKLPKTAYVPQAAVPSPVGARVAAKPNPALVSKSVSDLVSMLRNALAILGNPIRRPQHGDAAKVVAEVTLEWERRLDEMNAGRFPWPSTVARGGNGRLSFAAIQAEGMLAFMEYHVGRTNGEPEGVRRAILSRVFEGTLPPAFPKAYMEEWGRNGLVERLQKMALTIAAFVRNVKRRRSGDFADAIRDWENDLEWLRKTYYVKKFRFALGWPETSV